MTQMMHSGWFVGVAIAALVALCVMYVVIRVIGGRTQSDEQAAARTSSRWSARKTAPKRR